MVLLHLYLEGLTGKKLMRTAEVSFKVDITRSITWESSPGLVEEMSGRFCCPDSIAAGKRNELEKKTIKQKL